MPVETYCVIPDYKKTETEIRIEEQKAAVFAHLFYEDQLDFYQRYLKKIPEYIDVIIISSKDKILDAFEEERYKKIKKENRGRDISALLVAAGKQIFHYKYVCFIHDKKEKKAEQKEYIEFWKKNLWDNMLQSPEYLYNVLELFERDDRIGMLAPLPPHMGDQGVWLKGFWGGTFTHIKNLVYELGVKADVSQENPPFTYSTVFWARSEALKKLYRKDWQYTDFPDEPMRDLGEINHAVERILQYVVEDAGYEVRIALSSSFAASFIGQIQDELRDLWRRMEENFGIEDYDGIDRYTSRVKKILDFGKTHPDIYLYGAGKKGKQCLKICRLLDITPKGILVTRMDKPQDFIEGIPVFPISALPFSGETGVILSAGADYQREMEEVLRKIDFREYLLF